jgi:hypothetical protein
MARGVNGTPDFTTQEQRRQARFFATAVTKRELRDGYVLQPEFRGLNLFEGARAPAEAYFGPPRDIKWHNSAHSGLSSQIACLNFLMPLASRPDLLGEVIGRALGRQGLRMLPVEGGPHFVGFEWIGAEDYLGEWAADGKPTRGAQVTSADAVVHFEADGLIETLLIEWKYTESYGSPPDPKSEARRIGRYQDKAFAPDGPIRADLGLELRDLFWEPVYQMARQQMLAWRMQQAREDGAERVSVLHVSPCGNRAPHAITAPALQGRGSDDVFEAFRGILVRPQDFTAVALEDAFGATLADHQGEAWAAYLLARYGLAGHSGRPVGAEAISQGVA